MNALAIKHQLYIRHWQQEIDEFQRSGMKMKDWCKENGIPVSTFSSHCRAVRAEACNSLEERTGSNIIDLIRADTAPAIVDEKPPINLAQVHLASENSPTGIHIQCQSVAIDIGPQAPPEQLRLLLEVMLNAK